MRPIPVVFSADRCSCGALLDNNASRCRKCRNRARWLRRKVERLSAGLARIDGIQVEPPAGTFYVFPDVRGLYDRPLGPNGRVVHSAEELSAYLLDEALVVTVPGEAFGTPGFIRLSYALAMDQLQEGVARLQSALSSD